MKVLFITRDYLNGNGGGVYASRAYINAFAEISSFMTLVFPVKPNCEAEGLNEKITNLYPIDYGIPKWRKGIRMLCGRISPFDNLPDSFFDNSKYEVVVFNNSCASQGLLSKFKKARIKVITIHHNFELAYLKDNLSLFPWFSNYIATYFAEKKAFRESDLNLTLTYEDEKLFREHYSRDSISEVIGVFEYENKEVKHLNEESQNIPTFVITGDLSMPQTYNSLSEWIKLYYPSLLRMIPDAHLIMAGKNPSKDIKELCEDNNIELIPSPIDMDVVLNRGDYYICPISKGSGLKLRVLDGLKSGMPVITHEVSARGYESLIEGGIVFKYSSVEEFEDCITRLLSRKLSKQEIISEYCRLFSFNSGLSKLRKILINHDLLL